MLQNIRFCKKIFRLACFSAITAFLLIAGSQNINQKTVQAAETCVTYLVEAQDSGGFKVPGRKIIASDGAHWLNCTTGADGRCSLLFAAEGNYTLMADGCADLGAYIYCGDPEEVLTLACDLACIYFAEAVAASGAKLANRTISTSSGASCTTGLYGEACLLSFPADGTYTVSAADCTSQYAFIDCSASGEVISLPCQDAPPSECSENACLPCADLNTCLYSCLSDTDCQEGSTTPTPIPHFPGDPIPTNPETGEPICLCGQTCCPAEQPKTSLAQNPCSVENVDCNENPQLGVCQFPLNYNQCPWRTEGDYDCNPLMWSVSSLNPFVWQTGDVCVNPAHPTSQFTRSHPTLSCRYQVPAQNYIKTEMEVCNDPVTRPTCSRSSGMMNLSSASCGGVNQVAYLQKYNQCCDPPRNIWVAGGNIPVCSATESPDSRCSACNGWDGTRCVDGVTDVCRKAVEVKTYETRTRSTQPPAGASCAACVERQVTGQELSCSSTKDCIENVCPAGGETWDCSLDPAATGLGQFCCGIPGSATSPIANCSGTPCCASCVQEKHCYNYTCSLTSATNFAYQTSGCDGDENAVACGSGSGNCLHDSSCCRIQNEQRPQTCSWKPNSCQGCEDADGNAIDCCQPGYCLREFDADGNPVCFRAPVTCGGELCCGAEYCGENLTGLEYFPPEAENCIYYESFTRENMYTVKYESNKITLTYDIENLSNHRIFDVRAILQIPDFLDFSNTYYEPGYGSWSLWANGQEMGDENDPVYGNRFTGNPLGEYVESKAHGGEVHWHFTNFQTRAYYLSGPPECMENGVNRCQDFENGGWKAIHVFTYPGDRLPGPDGILNTADDITGLISKFKIKLELVPADIDSQGESYYADHCIPSSEIEHYTNNLISDDRLTNLEFKVFWPGSNPLTGEQTPYEARSRVIEPTSFWIGKGVKSTAGPTCTGSACFIDPDARPFGWPTFGEIAEDWGGADDIASATNIQWTNPMASENAWDSANNTARITLVDGQNGEYISSCGNSDPTEMGWLHAGITIIPTAGEASPPYVYSTQAGYVTHVGYDADYPGRGYYVEIASSIDDDCQYNYVTRYGNLMEMHDEQGKDISSRVQVGDYVPRHKILGVMGDTGDTNQLRLNPLARFQHTGITRTLYQIRYNGMVDDLDDNNVYNPGPGTDDETQQVDPTPIGNPLFSLYFTEPDDVCRNASSCGGDTCWNNPYICEYSSWQNYGPCDLAGYNPVFFCQNRRAPETVSRCYYANP